MSVVSGRVSYPTDYGAWGQENITANYKGRAPVVPPSTQVVVQHNVQAVQMPTSTALSTRHTLKAMRFKVGSPDEYDTCPNCAPSTTIGSDTYADDSADAVSAGAQASALLSSVRKFFRGNN